MTDKQPSLNIEKSLPDIIAKYQTKETQKKINTFLEIAFLQESGQLDDSLWLSNLDEPTTIITILSRMLVKKYISIGQKTGNESATQQILDETAKTSQELMESQNAFFDLGESWLIKYRGGKPKSIQNRKRLHYVIHLLDNPNSDFSAISLYSAVMGHDENKIIDENYSQISGEKLSDEEGLNLTDFTIEGLSEDEEKGIKTQIERIYNDLEFAKKKNNENKIKKAKLILNQMKDYLFNNYGLIIANRNGKILIKQKTRQNPEFEKARVNVKKSISKAIQDIKKEIPTLADHLNRCIKTGKYCAYEPELGNPPHWLISWR